MKQSSAGKTTPQEAREAFQRQLRPFASRELIQLLCGRCNKAVPGDMEWICGYCRHPNLRTRTYSFLNRCQSCGKEPKSLVCPHCEAMVFLTDEKDGMQPARKFVALEEPPPTVDPREQKRKAHEDEVEELNRQIQLAEKNALLARAKAAVDIKPEKSEKEKSVDQLVNRIRSVLKLELAAPKARAMLLDEFKDNPEIAGRIDEVIKMIIEEQDFRSDTDRRV